MSRAENAALRHLAMLTAADYRGFLRSLILFRRPSAAETLRGILSRQRGLADFPKTRTAMAVGQDAPRNTEDQQPLPDFAPPRAETDEQFRLMDHVFEAPNHRDALEDLTLSGLRRARRALRGDHSVE